MQGLSDYPPSRLPPTEAQPSALNLNAKIGQPLRLPQSECPRQLLLRETSVPALWMQDSGMMADLLMIVSANSHSIPAP
jgi:hypothetical protein